MKRWVWFSTCAVLGLVMLVCGLLVPAHLRAVDASVLERAGRTTPGLITRGMASLRELNLGVAELLFEAARAEDITGLESPSPTVLDLMRADPDLRLWGCKPPGKMSALHQAGAATTPSPPQTRTPETITEFLVRSENRRRGLELLQDSSNRAVQELLRFRTRTNTVLFSPAESSSGQALDSALLVCGLLLEAGVLTPGLSNTFSSLAAEANRGGDSQRFEQALLDTMSLGQRFNWAQLVAFVGKIEDAETLRRLTNQVRNADKRLPVLFAAVQLSEEPADVAGYLVNFSQTGLTDLGASLRFGAGGVKELVRRNQRLSDWSVRQLALAYDPFGSFVDFAAYCGWRATWLALAMKWVFYLVGGFLIALAVHIAKPPVSGLEQPLQVRGIHVAREFLFALGFLLVVLVLSEPFLVQDSQKVNLPFHLRLPMVGGAGHAGTASAKPTIMNQTNLNLLTMLLFFVLQGLLYTGCLVKLAEIRRQNVPPRMKLRLLENEEHLFDAGLYLGFLGTIISFVVYSLWAAHQFSLMVAYSSTSFGIIFVSLFKICHLRPLRRKLLLETEALSPDYIAPAVTPTLTTQP